MVGVARCPEMSERFKKSAQSHVLEEPIFGRQARESSRQWAGFQTYRDLAPEKRSCREVAKALGMSPRHVERWSARLHWKQRAAAHDADVDRSARELLKKELLEMRREQITVGRGLVSVAVQYLKHCDATDLSAKEAVLMIAEGFKQQSLGLGQPSEIISHVETAEQRRDRIIAAARRKFREGRAEFPDYPEHKLKKRIADHFGITPKDIDEPSG